MSDIEPLPDLQLDDPTLTRLIRRRVQELDEPSLARAAAQLTTSMSIVLTEPGDLTGVIEVLSGWNAPRLRTELLVVADEPQRGPDRYRLAAGNISWRRVPRSDGGRAGTLAAAAEQADNEFVMVLAGPPVGPHLVEGVLAAMWAHGGDVAVIVRPDDAAAADEAGVAAQPAADPAAQLAGWLGLGAAVAGPRHVIMRRWVARWLFNEVTRSICPGEEVADRARLLGVGIVVVSAHDHTPPS